MMPTRATPSRSGSQSRLGEWIVAQEPAGRLAPAAGRRPAAHSAEELGAHVAAAPARLAAPANTSRAAARSRSRRRRGRRRGSVIAVADPRRGRRSGRRHAAQRDQRVDRRPPQLGSAAFRPRHLGAEHAVAQILDQQQPVARDPRPESPARSARPRAATARWRRTGAPCPRPDARCGCRACRRGPAGRRAGAARPSAAPCRPPSGEPGVAARRGVALQIGDACASRQSRLACPETP